MIRVRSLHKQFHKHQVLKGIDLDVGEGQVVAIIGPSGSGKSTILRCINYLEKPEDGIIELDGRVIDARQAKKKRHSLFKAAYNNGVPAVQSVQA